MKYMGSKNRIAKHLLPIILKDRKEGQWYVEPFVGGANMIDKVEGNRIGADSNQHLISALKLVRDNPESIPLNNSEFTRADYEDAKKKHFSQLTQLECLMLFALSFSAMFGSSFAVGRAREDFVRAAKGNATKQSPKIQGVNFIDCGYRYLDLPTKSIVYCDPPYAKTTGYKGSDFNHTEFWQKCRDWCASGHQVFISEYAAPDDFACVWKKEISVSVAKSGKGKKGVEKLFVHKSQLNH
jgi:DNA adenine methylase